MSKITAKDLYGGGQEIDDAIKQLKALKETYVEVKKDIVAKAGDLQSSFSKTNVVLGVQKEEFGKLLTKVAELTKQYELMESKIKGIDKSIDDYTKAQKAAAAATAKAAKEAREAAKANEAHESSISALKKSLKTASDDFDKLVRANNATGEAGKKLIKTMAKLKAEIDLTNKEKKKAANLARLQVTINNAEVGSYNQLAAQYDLLKIKLNAMGTARRKNTASGRDMEAQAIRIREQMKRLQEATGKNTLSVGNYSGSLRSVGASLRNLIAVYFSVTQAAELFRKVFTDTKKLDSLNLAFEKTIPNLQENAQVQQFLAETAEKYGQNILVLSKAYLRFNAASKSSTLSMEDQQQIFDSVAKSAAVLGLEAAKTDRVFNALEQIMSKGTVSAEELRQQLGDSLPGSVEIMARALNVTTKELADMIKKGEVLASDALPKFARELEKTYGIENVNKVDNLVAAQGRFETAIVNLVKELDGAGVFKDFFDALTAGAKAIKDNIGALVLLGKGLAIALPALLAYKLGVIATTRAQNAMALSLTELRIAMSLNPFGVALTVITAVAIGVYALNESMVESINVHDKLSESVKDLNIELGVEKKKTGQLFDALKDFNIPLERRQEIYLELLRMHPDILKNIDLEKSGLEDLENAQENVNAAIRRNIAARLQQEEVDKIQARRDKIIDKQVRFQVEGAEGLSALERAGVVNGRTPRTVDEEGLTTRELFAKRYNELLDKQLAKEDELLTKTKELYELYRDDPQVDRVFGDRGDSARDKILARLGLGIGGRGKDKPKVLSKEEIAADRARKAAADKAISDEFKRRTLRAQLIEDDETRELALLEIKNDKLIREFEQLKVSTVGIEEKYQREIQKIEEKYDKKAQGKLDKQRQLNIDFIEDRTEREREQLDLDTEVFGRHIDNKLLILAFYARGLKKIEDRLEKENLARIKKAEQDRRKLYESNLAEFDKKQQAERANNFAKSAKTPTPFETALSDNDLEKKRLEFDLFQRTFVSKDLTASDAELFKANLAKIDKERENILKKGEAKEDKDLYDLLGIDVDDKSKQAVGDAFAYAKKQLTDFANFRKQVADQNVSAANREVASAEQALNREIAARNAGFANSVTTAEAELAAKKKIQAQALKEQKAAQKEQQTIQSIEQTVNLATAASKIFSQVGNPFISIPLVGLMFGAYAAAKIRANNLTKEYAGGAYEEFDYGGSHKSGNDMSLGMTKDGRQRRVERGESMMILPKSATKKYKNVMPSLFKQLKSGTYDPMDMDMSRENDVNYWTNTTEVNNDGLLDYFKSRDRRGRKGKNVIYSNGVEIVTNGNTKTYIHG